MSHPKGPPYASPLATVGGIPSIIPDIPICAVILATYVASAATNMTVFQLNNRKHHVKFIPTVLLFGFSMARIATMSLRIATAVHSKNIRLSLASTIFTNAGVLILYVENLIFAQRILRAERPHLGWNKFLRIVTKVLYSLIGAVLIMVITAVILMAYTLNRSTLSSCRDVLLAATTYLLFFATLPIFHLIAASIPSKLTATPEPLGRIGNTTSTTKKKALVTTTSLLILILAGFKTGTAYEPARPKSNPAWYDSKAAFYCFTFFIEMIVLWIMTLSRVDKLFWVPNGCKQAGDYTHLRGEYAHSDLETERERGSESEGWLVDDEKVELKSRMRMNYYNIFLTLVQIAILSTSTHVRIATIVDHQIWY